MLNFLRKPLGYALIVIVHCILANQVSSQFFTNQMITQFTWPLGVWTLAAFYIFLTTLLLYRLLIKQEPFSKEFKKSASKWYATLAIIQSTLYLVGGKILYMLNPEVATKLLSENILKLVNLPSSALMLIATVIALALIYPLLYWINYGYLWFADKIVNYFLKSKHA